MTISCNTSIGLPSAKDSMTLEVSKEHEMYRDYLEKLVIMAN